MDERIHCQRQSSPQNLRCRLPFGRFEALTGERRSAKRIFGTVRARRVPSVDEALGLEQVAALRAKALTSPGGTSTPASSPIMSGTPPTSEAIIGFL